ncbi:MAG TPA: phosphopantetheine-binding protein [Polyangiaceae bacterium]|nr:phosphopantetheine-binding protein [Polyangiaceae bacterium]
MTLEPARADSEARAIVVRECIATSLSLELDAVPLEANLMHDLGADSLTFLDIVFRLEQAFDIQITRGEMERAAKGNMSDDEFAPSGVISEAGLERLRSLIPESGQRIQAGLRPGQILGLFTARTFLNMVEGKLRGQAL